MSTSYWDTTSLDNLLLLYVGKTYGKNPSEHIAKIREAKKLEAVDIISMLGLTSTDIVVDLGPGCGFIAKEIAPQVKELHCIDISESFLDFCKEELRDISNIRYHHIKYSNVNLIPLSKVTKVYSTAVFIHFNLYDIFHYLRSIYMSLAIGGKVLFNFLDDKTLDIKNEVWVTHSYRYLKDRTNLFTNLYYNNADSVVRLAEQIGFTVISVTHTDQHCWLVLEK
jgi:cyclopropane fatty-acyl-phospholipid synthase-like methyltransferase